MASDDAGAALPLPTAVDDRAHLMSLVSRHCPKRMTEEQLAWLLPSIEGGRPVGAVVLAADIRRSTQLMKEAISFPVFARIMSDHVTGVHNGLRHFGAWFDKFTGDGYLAYWPYRDEDSFWAALNSALASAAGLISWSQREMMRQFRGNSRNWPDGVGLAIGLDAGDCYLVEVAEDLTIVGLPVVGAVRMAAAASANECLANVSFGCRIEQGGDRVACPYLVGLESQWRDTKEYRQEAYLVEFAGFDQEQIYRAGRFTRAG